MLFWKCPKCELRWQHNIGKCPYCLAQLQRREPEGLRVVGSTKVSLESNSHPIVPYTVLLLEDKDGNRFSKKTVAAYKLGESYPKRETGKKDVVLQRVKYDLRQPVEQCFAVLPLGFGQADEVLVNPARFSLLSQRYLRKSHMEVISSAMTALCKAIGREARFTIALPEEVLKNEKLLEKIVGGKKSQTPGLTAAEDSGAQGFKFLLNVPLLATHQEFMLWGAALNLLNLGGGSAKDTAGCVARASKKFKSIFSLCDATVGVEGNTFNRRFAHWQFLASGGDFVALDSVLCRVFSMPLPLYLKRLAAKGIGKQAIRSLAVSAEEWEALKMNAFVPFQAGKIGGS